MQLLVPTTSKYTIASDLSGKTITTSFTHITKTFFTPIDAQTNLKTKIEHMCGSVETSCDVFGSDAIVDIVDSGNSMRAAGLVNIATLMSSEAALIGGIGSGGIFGELIEDIRVKFLAQLEKR
jgi:ATP phosphoribosyltransferase